MSRLTLDLAYPMGTTVFRRVVEDREPGIVTGILSRPFGVLYLVSFADGERECFESELTDEYVPTYGDGE